MKTVVLKFGGTSVANIDRIKKVCKIIASYKKKRKKVLVISSAMSGVTNKLVKKSQLISNNFDKAEYDTLVSTGEQASCALIAGRLNHLGLKSRSWLSWQLPIETDGPYSEAKIRKVNIRELKSYLKSGGIPVITGFQGINNRLRITTIGRSGSDATAIMLAKFIKADDCIIYTDVDGVYTTDPKQYKKAKKIDKIYYDEMLEMASLGSKVMQPTSVQDAKLNNIDIKVKSSFISKPGTLITGSKKNLVIKLLLEFHQQKMMLKLQL
jgi:aspartate kinase